MPKLLAYFDDPPPQLPVIYAAADKTGDTEPVAAASMVIVARGHGATDRLELTRLSGRPGTSEGTRTKVSCAANR
jgi:hypothetical protein